MLDLTRFEALSFDCYGTLIDWETGLLTSLRSVLDAHGVSATNDELLAEFARYESAAEQPPFKPYATVLRDVLSGYARRRGLAFSDHELGTLARTIGDWPAFSDTPAALARLHRHYKLAVLSNVDDELFARTAPRLGEKMDWVVTAQQVGSYKPDPRNFQRLLAVTGIAKERLLHVAQSLHHDHVPAQALGFNTVWIDRRAGKPGGATLPTDGAKYDARFETLAAFADAVDAAFG